MSRSTSAQAAGRPGVRTHQLLIAILGSAAAKGSRLDVIREIRDAVMRRGDYANSVEELTPLDHDPVAALPILAAALTTLIFPSAGRWLERAAVDSYALASDAWAQIVENAPVVSDG